AVVLGRSRLTKKGIVFGTPHYMSPEQASGHAVDHRSDIYALGIVLYEMVTGRVPFEGDTYMGVLTQHMYAAPTPPTKLSPRLARELGPLEPVILRALEKEPEARHATMDAFAGAITEALGRAAGPTPSWPAPQSPSQRAPRGIADELELPSLAELRGSVERASSAPPPRSRAVRRAAWLGALGALVVGSAVLALSALRHTQVAPAETAIVATPPPPPSPSQAPIQPPAPPEPSALPSATAAHPPLVRRPKPASKAPTAPGLGPDPFLTAH
ncbi:MAG TPA: protein kinase, partial [Polyangiaceae bacterium]|nr:protein kinase [Polyangiaceae bacterium]